MWGLLSNFHIFFLRYGLKIIQKSIFLQFCAEFSNKTNSVKEMFVYAPERSHYTL